MIVPLLFTRLLADNEHSFHNTYEFSLNYTNLPMSPIKATKKNKINSAKKLPSVGIEPRTSGSSQQCSTDSAMSICGCLSESLRPL